MAKWLEDACNGRVYDVGMELLKEAPPMNRHEIRKLKEKIDEK